MAIDIVEAVIPSEHVYHPRIEPVEGLVHLAMTFAKDRIIEDRLMMHDAITKIADGVISLMNRLTSTHTSGNPHKRSSLVGRHCSPTTAEHRSCVTGWLPKTQT